MTVVWLFIIIVTVSVHVAGSKLEALDGENVTIPFESKLERVDEVKVVFEGENKGKLLFAHYCFRETDPACDVKSDHLQVEGRNVLLILLKVNSSRTGLYGLRAFFGKEVDDEVTATLVVNKRPISSSAAPPQTSTSKPPNYSKHQGLLITVVIIICFSIIVVLASHYFWKHRRVLSFQNRKDWKPLHTEIV